VLQVLPLDIITVFLYIAGMISWQVNPGKAPQVVSQLLDDDCPEEFIRGLLLSVRSLLPVEPLVEECEKRSFSLPATDSVCVRAK
jgi:hypothetical protein